MAQKASDPEAVFMQVSARLGIRGQNTSCRLLLRGRSFKSCRPSFVGALPVRPCQSG